MITNEMLQVVAEYDGWRQDEVVDNVLGRLYNNPQRAHLGDNLGEGFAFLSQMKYLTSMDWLHPVALKAYSELIDCKYNDISDITDKCETIHSAMMCKPINGQYIDLFKANYEAILFIKQNKTTNNEQSI